MTTPIAIEGLGMVSSLAHGAEANAALMRCGYDNTLPTHFRSRTSMSPYLGARIQELESLGASRYADMAVVAVTQALATSDVPVREIALELCLPQVDEIDLEDFQQDFLPLFRSNLQTSQQAVVISPQSRVLYRGRCGLARAVQGARQHLAGDCRQVLVVCVDSLLGSRRIAKYDEGDGFARILDDNSPDGFIPGEAATALLLSRPTSSKEQTCITGVGFDDEATTVTSDEVLTGRGLLGAVRQAVDEAGIRVCDTDFRISSGNGESYFFREAAMVAAAALEEKREAWPLWHPADHIGETGAAVGGAMAIMAHYAFVKGYAPGKRALCQLSNDDGQRAAFVIERWTGQ